MQPDTLLSSSENSRPTSQTSAAIRFSGVSKSFERTDASRLLAVEDVSFEVKSHTIVALLGPSGSGKTTLLNLAAGLIEPDRGEIRIAGRAGKDIDWARIGYMFQDDRLLPWRTAADNVALALEAGEMTATERRARTLAMLELVGLHDFAQTYPHELSGGMRSRIALARSLVTHANILLMDEPFARLDVQTRAQMHAQLLAVQTDRELAILFVTHDAEEAVMLADEIVVLSPRPGRVRDQLPVMLPRPRATDVEALSLITELRRQIGTSALT